MFEGRGYKGRVSLFTKELDRGNVSLQLRDFRRSDVGDYLCQVTSTDRTEEITIRLLQGGFWNRDTLKGALVGVAGAAVAGAAVTGAAAAGAGAGAAAIAVTGAAGAAAGAYFFKPEILTTDMIHKTWSKEERKKMTESSLLAGKRNSKEYNPPAMSVEPTQNKSEDVEQH